MVEVIGTDEFADWYRDLDDPAGDAIDRIVGLLEGRGVALGHPSSSAVHGSKYPLRELRTQAGGRAIRIFYIFDPKRQAVLLLGGIKDGAGADRFYEEHVPRAEKVWEQYKKEGW